MATKGSSTFGEEIYGVNNVTNLNDQLKSIQPDFQSDFIPIWFIIIDYENISFVNPTMTIDQLLTSESLQERLKNECERVGINSLLLDSASIVPNIEHQRTVHEWVQQNAENPMYIAYKYKTELPELFSKSR